MWRIRRPAALDDRRRQRRRAVTSSGATREPKSPIILTCKRRRRRRRRSSGSTATSRRSRGTPRRPGRHPWLARRRGTSRQKRRRRRAARAAASRELRRQRTETHTQNGKVDQPRRRRRRGRGRGPIHSGAHPAALHASSPPRPTVPKSARSQQPFFLLLSPCSLSLLCQSVHGALLLTAAAWRPRAWKKVPRPTRESRRPSVTGRAGRQAVCQSVSLSVYSMVHPIYKQGNMDAAARRPRPRP